MKPFTGADLQRMAREGDEELQELWDKALIVGYCKGYREVDILEMTLEDIFAEDK